MAPRWLVLIALRRLRPIWTTLMVLRTQRSIPMSLGMQMDQMNVVPRLLPMLVLRTHVQLVTRLTIY